MKFSLQEAIEILSRTPKVLRELLEGFDLKWLNFRKRDDAFSPLDVMGHLILGEKTDWILRMKIMISTDGPKEFPPFNRTGFEESLGINDLLNEFETLRTQNVKILSDSVTDSDLDKTGIHPELGKVTLEQHLATWVVHDLTHLFQITESLALQYKEAVGPWIEYLKILKV
ncbi:MAG: DinB family protein [Candidatus Hodarchaeales archaeon]|jgi:hypothetical protein